MATCSGSLEAGRSIPRWSLLKSFPITPEIDIIPLCPLFIFSFTKHFLHFWFAHCQIYVKGHHAQLIDFISCIHCSFWRKQTLLFLKDSCMFRRDIQLALEMLSSDILDINRVWLQYGDAFWLSIQKRKDVQCYV